MEIWRGLEERHVDRIDVVDILFHRLDAPITSAENTIPETRLLAVVVTLPPALAVVQVVVFNNDIAVEHLQQPAHSRGHGQVDADAAMTEDLGEGNVLVADPPFIEAHRQANKLKREVGHQRDAHHVEKLLLVVCVGGEEGVRVLGQVVGAVVLPQRTNIVHQAVVPVEEEVEDDAVEADFEREPLPVHHGWGLAHGVGEVG